MRKFFIDKQPDGWRWYSYEDNGAIRDMVRGFKTRTDALVDARARVNA